MTTIYHLHPATGVFLGVGQADESPLEPGVFLLPAHSTAIEPPTFGEGQRAVFDGAAWNVEAIPAPLPPDPAPGKTAEQLAAEARELAKANRAATVARITIQTQAGNIFNGDEEAQTRMSRAAAGLMVLNERLAAGTPIALPAEVADIYRVEGAQYQTVWVLADNTPVFVGAAELQEALVLAGARQSAVWVIP